MATEAKKETKPKTAKPAAKAPAKPAAEKAAAKAAPAATGKVKVTQVIGSIARRHDQRATLIGLGLNKRHRSKILIDTPEVRGMINKVRHLITVEKAS